MSQVQIKEELESILLSSNWRARPEWYDFIQSIEFHDKNSGRMVWGQNQRVQIDVDFCYQLLPNNVLKFEFFDTERKSPGRTRRTFERTEMNAFQQVEFLLIKGSFLVNKPYGYDEKYQYILRFFSQPFPVGWNPSGDLLDYYGWLDRSIEALGEIGNDESFELLLLALKDGDFNIARRAAQTLGKLGDARAVEALIIALKKRTSNEEKLKGIPQQVALALGQIKDSRALEPLVESLADENERVRADVVEALGQLGDPRAVEPLIARINDKSYIVRQRIVEALAALGDKKAVAPLITLLKDEVVQVRGLSAAALLKLDLAQALDVFSDILHNEPFEVSWVIATALERNDELANQLLQSGTGHIALALQIIERLRSRL